MIRIYSAVLVLLCFVALAQGQQAEPAKEVKEAPGEQYPFFTDAENRLILDFYRPGSGHVPPGLAKRDNPPSAVAPKPLSRGGMVPATLEKALEPFPKDLDRRLTTVPSGYRRVLYGTTALLVQDATRLIVDALDLPKR